MSKSLDDLRKRLSGEEKEVSGMAIDAAKKIEVTASEIAEAVNANPDHPVAKIYGPAVAGSKPADLVAVDAVDLQALLDNRAVNRVPTTEGGRKVFRKELGDPIKKETTEAKPAPEAPKPKSPK